MGAKTESPTPPPITIPSQHEIWRAFSWETLKSKINSSLKKVSLSKIVEVGLNRALTSPPAQNAFPPWP